ncbi:MAG: DUF1150 family protein [Pseudomonadota bacterium]
MEESQNMHDLLKQISVQDFLSMGVDQIAYIKPIQMDDNHTGFSVHAADGRQISMIDSYPSAVALIQQNDMHPITLH